jgi:hypothetical protein
VQFVPLPRRQFEREVRAGRWRSLMPLVACVLGGAALLAVAGAPPSEGVREALEAERISSLATIHALDVFGPNVEYQLPSHWSWPRLSMLTELDPEVG